jgi:hypothetical protein
MGMMINNKKVFNTSELSKVFGVSLSVGAIKNLGFEPYAFSNSANYWSAELASDIAMALAEKLIICSENLKELANE